MKIGVCAKALSEVNYEIAADQVINSRGDVVGQMDPYGTFQTTDEVLIGVMAIPCDSCDCSDTKPTKAKRARNAKGHLVADDPSTPDINEAWEQ